MTATPDTATARPRFADTLAVYLKPRLLIVLFLGFSAGLPLALSGSTLLFWMREAGVDLGTIGLFALVVNAALLGITAGLTDSLDVGGFFPTVLAAIVISLVTSVLLFAVNRMFTEPAGIA